MWVAELGCELGHTFEGWFGSRDDFDSQCQRGLVTCPQCGSSAVARRLTAPRLNLGADPTPQPASSSPTSTGPSAPVPPGAAARALVAYVRAHTEDVGPRFAAEVRRMHAHEAPERAIRGQATVDEFLELQDEGIDVLPLPPLDADSVTH